MQPSEEIKSRLDIVDVIREYIQLQAAGVNFRAKCPFHREKTPSFVVSPEKQIYHCFGCGEGGDIFSFVMKMEGIEFVEALRLLAPKAGVALKKQNPEAASKRNKILDMLDLSRRYYHKIFLGEASARNAREYIKKRALSADTIEEWQIGYSLDSWDTVGKLLRAKGYKENEIFVAGLIVKSNKSNRFYDRFRGRIMFPINDVNGNTVAFSARISPEKEAVEKMGKYINSPQTPVYDKSKILFGLDKAKLEIKKEDLAIVVEGQMD
ncbi:DNA primase, partial [Candidatus Parcubacteria bacterium]|nr:DNA primase [Candidatus Parcubacteria bacterium]